MNKDKVYLGGYVVGCTADTLGHRGLLVQLGNSEIVEIDKDLVHKNINEPQPIKLKDVIARIGEFNLATKAVWINEILNKLGSDYGTLKYKDGYEQGKLEGSLIPYEEPQKPVVPQFVAEFIEESKNRGFHLLGVMRLFEDPSKFDRWFYEDTNMEIFALAWINGYTVEEEKRYRVKIIGIKDYYSYLNYRKEEKGWTVESKMEVDTIRTSHTRKELEQAGFGWVFDCEGIEIEEVEE